MSENNISREPMPDERLADIKARLMVLPEGPWFVADCEGDLQIWRQAALRRIVLDKNKEISGYQLPASYGPGDLIAEWDLDTWDAGEDDGDDLRRDVAHFLAAARQDVPALLDEVDRFRAELADLRGQNAMTEANFTDYAEATHEENERLRAELSRVQEEASTSLAKLAAENERLQADNQRLRTGIAETIGHIGETAVWTQPLLAMLDAATGSAE